MESGTHQFSIEDDRCTMPKIVFIYKEELNVVIVAHVPEHCLPKSYVKLEFVFYVKTDVSTLSTCMSKICKQEL